MRDRDPLFLTELNGSRVLNLTLCRKVDVNVTRESAAVPPYFLPWKSRRSSQFKDVLRAIKENKGATWLKLAPVGAHVSKAKNREVCAARTKTPQNTTLNITLLYSCIRSTMPLVFPFPPLSATFAHLLSLSSAFAYVASIYLSKNSRLSFSGKVVHTVNGQARPKEQDERWRDDPDVIRARLVAVSLATLVCCLGVIGVVGCFVGDVENVSYKILHR